MNGRMRGRQANLRRVAGRIDATNDLARLEHGTRGMIVIDRHRSAQFVDDALVEAHGNEIVDRARVVDDADTHDAGLRQRAGGSAHLLYERLWIALGHEALRLLEQAGHALSAIFEVHYGSGDNISTLRR